MKRETQRLRSVAADGIGTIGTGVGAQYALGAAAKGSQGRETRGGGSTREEDVRGTLPGPKPYSTAGCAAPIAVAVLRRVRVEMRTVSGSATEASDGGVGAREGKSDRVAP